MVLLCSMMVSAQKENSIKTDSLYFSGDIPKIKDSKTSQIVVGVKNICDPNQEKIIDTSVEANREFNTVSTLKTFNKEANTSIFTSADVVIVSYFCQNIDYADGIEFYEFIFKDDKSAQILLDKLTFLYKKVGFNNYIGYKKWFFKRIKNSVYFINAKQENPVNSIKDQLQKNIEAIRE